jgi:hypothetical protein
VLLLRLCAGLAIARRLLSGSHATGRSAEGIEIRESDGVASPVVLGIVHPVILLPKEWREWHGAKLDAMLAHERSHILRHDPAVQLVSAIHRALLWHSPLTWLLHRRIVRVAEEASDDAAVAAIRDRGAYAELLMDFMRRSLISTVPRANWQGVPMARYDSPAVRIQRILDGTAPSRGVTRWSIASVLALGAPLAYLVGAVHPQNMPQAPVVAAAQLATAPAAVQPTTTQPAVAAAAVARPQKGPPPAAAADPVGQPQTPTPQLNYASGTDGYLLQRERQIRTLTPS